MGKRIILTKQGEAALKDPKNTGPVFEGLKKANISKEGDEIEYKKFCSDFISSLDSGKARKLVRAFSSKKFLTLDKTPFKKVQEKAASKGLKVTKTGKVKEIKRFVNLKCTSCKRTFRIHINKQNENLYTPLLRKTWKCDLCRNSTSKKEVKKVIAAAKKLGPIPIKKNPLPVEKEKEGKEGKEGKGK